MRITYLTALLALLPLILSARADDGVPPLDQTMEPEVVITPRDQGRVKEYRVNGRLYMIEIVPTKGAPYYLIDTDGDGLLDNRQNHLEPELAVPRWPVLRW